MLRLIAAQVVNNVRSPVFSGRARFFASLPSVRIHDRSVSTPFTTAETAVTHILHHTPPPTSSIPLIENRHVLNCLVQKEPDVISRVSSTLSSRGYKIESLVATSTEVQDLSRITVVLNGTNDQIEQARRQLEDLVPVWTVLDYTNMRLVERELLLIKVSLLGLENLCEPYNNKLYEKNTDMNEDNKDEDKEAWCESGLERTGYLATPAETFSHLRSLSELTRHFGGKVIDISSDSIMIELCGKSSRISSFIKLCKPFGILESSRSGIMAMPRSPVRDDYESVAEQLHEIEAMDTSLLPPG